MNHLVAEVWFRRRADPPWGWRREVAALKHETSNIKSYLTTLVSIPRSQYSPRKLVAMLGLTGTTGKIGGAVLNAILEENLIPVNELVICTSSDPDDGRWGSLKSEGARVRKSNYDDPDSMAKAFSGCSKLFLASKWTSTMLPMEKVERSSTSMPLKRLSKLALNMFITRPLLLGRIRRLGSCKLIFEQKLSFEDWKTSRLPVFGKGYTTNHGHYI